MNPSTHWDAAMQAATEAQQEAKAYTNRGLLEAIYILLRRNEIMQQNVASKPQSHVVMAPALAPEPLPDAYKRPKR
jgi:hypothetical protein